MRRALLTLGLLALLGCAPEKAKENKQSTAQQEIKIEQETAEEAPARSYTISTGPQPSFYTSPSDLTGISAEVRAWVRDEGRNAGIAQLRIYQDDQQIFLVNNSDYGSLPVSQTTPGTRTYHAEAIDNDGKLLQRLDCAKGNSCFHLIDLVKLHRQGIHTYFAEVIDLGENITRSETLTVNYK